jgi:hypothetical protein
MTLMVEGSHRVATHYNVAPGATVTIEWRAPVPAGGDTLSITIEAFARDGADARPEDNRRTAILRRP